MKLPDGLKLAESLVMGGDTVGIEPRLEHTPEGADFLEIEVVVQAQEYMSFSEIQRVVELAKDFGCEAVKRQSRIIFR